MRRPNVLIIFRLFKNPSNSHWQWGVGPVAKELSDYQKHRCAIKPKSNYRKINWKSFVSYKATTKHNRVGQRRRLCFQLLPKRRHNDRLWPFRPLCWKLFVVTKQFASEFAKLLFWVSLKRIPGLGNDPLFGEIKYASPSLINLWIL